MTDNIDQYCINYISLVQWIFYNYYFNSNLQLIMILIEENHLSKNNIEKNIQENQVCVYHQKFVVTSIVFYCHVDGQDQFKMCWSIENQYIDNIQIINIENDG